MIKALRWCLSLFIENKNGKESLMFWFFFLLQIKKIIAFKSLKELVVMTLESPEWSHCYRNMTAFMGETITFLYHMELKSIYICHPGVGWLQIYPRIVLILLKPFKMWAILREGNSNPLQYSWLESPRNRGAWQVTVHGVTKTWTWLSN